MFLDGVLVVFLIFALSTAIALAVLSVVNKRIASSDCAAPPRVYVNVYKDGREAGRLKRRERRGSRRAMSGMDGGVGYDHTRYSSNVHPSNIGVRLLSKNNKRYPKYSGVREPPEPSNYHFP